MRWTQEQAAEIHKLVSELWRRPTDAQWTEGWQGALGKFEGRTVEQALRALASEWESNMHPRPAHVAAKCRELIGNQKATPANADSLLSWLGLSEQVFRRLDPGVQALYRDRWESERRTRAHEAAGLTADGKPRDPQGLADEFAQRNHREAS